MISEFIEQYYLALILIGYIPIAVIVGMFISKGYSFVRDDLSDFQSNEKFLFNSLLIVCALISVPGLFLLPTEHPNIYFLSLAFLFVGVIIFLIYTKKDNLVRHNIGGYILTISLIVMSLAVEINIAVLLMLLLPVTFIVLMKTKGFSGALAALSALGLFLFVLLN